MPEPRREPLVLLLATLAALAVSAVRPYEWGTWWMAVAPVLIGVPILVATHRAFPLTTLCYRLLFVHALILVLGGHYIHARVPVGFSVRDRVDLSRGISGDFGSTSSSRIPIHVRSTHYVNREPA